MVGEAHAFFKRYVNIPFSSSAHWIIHGFSAPRLEQGRAKLLSQSSPRRSDFHGGGVCGPGGRKFFAVIVLAARSTVAR